MAGIYRQQSPEAQELLLNVSLHNREDREALGNGFWGYTIHLPRSRWFHPAIAPPEAQLLFDHAWDLAQEGQSLNLQGVVCLIGLQRAVLFTPRTVGHFEDFETGQFERESAVALNPRLPMPTQRAQHLHIVRNAV